MSLEGRTFWRRRRNAVLRRDAELSERTFRNPRDCRDAGDTIGCRTWPKPLRTKEVEATMKKTIVIGLDGLEPRIVEAMLEAGQLPNLAELRRRGGFSRVATTSPA